MLFKRREKESFWTRLAQWVWPRAGWRRTWQYVGHRLGRMHASPHAIAAGFASGVAISFTPFLGFHIAGAGLISLAVRGHFISSVIGTLIGNPWTFPLIFAFTGSFGAAILGEPLSDLVPTWSWSALFENPGAYLLSLLSTLKPFIVGGIPTAVVAWILSYSLLKRGLIRYRAKRRARIAAKPALPAAQRLKEGVATLKEKAQTISDAHREKQALKADGPVDPAAPAE